jgi:hypothetical protein
MSTASQTKPRSRGTKFKFNPGGIVQVIETHPGGFSLGITLPLVSVPDEINASKAAASADISQHGLVPLFTGAATARNAFVASQDPKPNSVVPKGTTVSMRLVAGPTP